MKRVLILLLVIAASGCIQQILPPGERGHSLRSAAAVKGQDVFIKNCNRCHPGGMGGLGPAIINKPLPGFLIKFQVREGLGAMPSFKKQQISKADLDNLIEYIKERKLRK
ncbi:MAG TPA: cytochrome c [Bacteroidales bacterium]|jgi:mono/diheme cytochrome c family protein|nr:cytochrome c [Bacteroidales bacterium]